MGKEKAAPGHRGPCVKPLAWVYVDTDGIDGNFGAGILMSGQMKTKEMDSGSPLPHYVPKIKTEQKYPDCLFKIIGLNLCL